MLTAGADTQVRQRQITGCQAGLQQVRRDVIRTQVSSLHFTGQTLGSLGDIPLPAVVGRDLQNKTIAARRRGFRLAHRRLQFRMEARAVTNDPQTDVVVVEALGLATQRLEEQVHQGADFIGGALPVLTGEGKQGEHLDLGLGTHLDHRPHRIDTGLVAGDARQETLLGPAIVAIHDDRHMARHRGWHSLLGLFH